MHVYKEGELKVDSNTFDTWVISTH